MLVSIVFLSLERFYYNLEWAFAFGFVIPGSTNTLSGQKGYHFVFFCNSGSRLNYDNFLECNSNC